MSLTNAEQNLVVEVLSLTLPLPKPRRLSVLSQALADASRDQLPDARSAPAARPTLSEVVGRLQALDGAIGAPRNYTKTPPEVDAAVIEIIRAGGRCSDVVKYRQISKQAASNQLRRLVATNKLRKLGLGRWEVVE